MASSSSYWALTRAPRYSLIFALPLLVLYELLAFVLSHDAINGVRNGADVVLKSLFLAVGGRWGLVLFGVVVIGTGVALVVQDLKRNRGALRRTIYLGMFAESIVYALLLGTVVSTLTGLLLQRLAIVDGVAKMGLPTQLMVSLGAGLYEELLFRVILVGALAAICRKGFGWAPWLSGCVAALIGAVIFSAFHYVGLYGDTFAVASFVFRAIAGLVFSGMYLTRGFGITAWSHALYDVVLSVIS